MTGQELQQRNGKSGNLKVFQISDGQYIVESSKGKICYKVTSQNGTKLCSCADYTTNILKDQKFLCKHILAALNSNGDSIKIELLQKEKAKLDERFITNIKGKDFVVYAGLLDLGHQLGISKFRVESVQYPTKDNGMEAICIATLTTPNGNEYEEVGDANPKNVHPFVSGHVLRVAATRAKARVLRDYTNVGMTCLEELGSIEDMDDDASKNKKNQAGKKTYGKPDEKPKAEAKPQPSGNTDKPSTTSNKPDNSKADAKTDKPAEPAKPDTAKTESKSAGTGKADESKPAETQKAPSPDGNGKITPAQMNAIKSISKRRGITDEELVQRSMQVFNVDIQFLSSKDASVFIRELQQSA